MNYWQMIKSRVSIIGPVLHILFKKVLNSGIFPQLWSVGYISPSLSIRRFWGKSGKMEAKKGES